MAAQTFFDPTTLARPVKDLQRIELRNKLRDQEVVLNADRVIADANETKLGQYADAGAHLSTQNQTLTDNTAFDLFTFPLAALAGACWEVRATVYATDAGGDISMISILFHVNAVNKAGTVVAVVTEGVADVVADSASGTLTLAGAAAEGTANLVDVSVLSVSSMTTNVFKIDWEARCIGASAAASRVGTKVNANS